MTPATDAMTLTGRLADGDRTGYREVCPIERALDTIGTRSALVLLREAFWGTTRFEDFAQRAGFTEQIAATRLKQLVDAGVLAKQPYKSPGQRTRYEYVLTGRGRQLFPVLVSLVEFGMLLQGDARRLDLVHGEGCGAPLVTHVQCAEGHNVQLAQAEARLAAQTKALSQATNHAPHTAHCLNAPMVGAWIGFAAGLMMVMGTLMSVAGTLVVPRAVNSPASRMVDVAPRHRVSNPHQAGALLWTQERDPVLASADVVARPARRVAGHARRRLCALVAAEYERPSRTSRFPKRGRRSSPLATRRRRPVTARRWSTWRRSPGWS